MLTTQVSLIELLDKYISLRVVLFVVVRAKKMNLIGEKVSEQFEFNFEVLVTQLPFKLYTEKRNAIRALKSRCVQGLEYIEVKSGKKIEYFLNVTGVSNFFFNENRELIDPFAEKLREKDRQIATLEAELAVVNKMISERFVEIPKVEKMPLIFLLRKHGRKKIKDFLSSCLEGLTHLEVNQLAQSWDLIAAFADQHEEIRQPLLTVFSYFCNPYTLQQNLGEYFKECKPLKQNDSIQRAEWRIKQRNYRERKKQQKCN